MNQSRITVNGRVVEKGVPGDRTLVRFLREECGLTGTHEACDTGHCGACTVWIDGKAVKSCMVLTASLDGSEVTTIEGVGTPDKLHPMQAAFRDNHGLQCGFCTPGMVMAAIKFVEAHREAGVALTDEAIRAGMTGNICRCTGYQNIVESIRDAAQQM